ncbi:MAG: hypothetical protein AAB654_07370, partial [Acidobacteriota bacterium]
RTPARPVFRRRQVSVPASFFSALVETGLFLGLSTTQQSWRLHLALRRGLSRRRRRVGLAGIEKAGAVHASV